MDRLYLMSTFVAVVECRGFAGAARKLNLSPPAVTRAITELEKRLGVQLLIRTTRIVTVTDAGARYAEDCRRVIAAANDADEAAAGIHGTIKGALVVTAPALFGPLFVAPLITRFLRAYPDTSVSCVFIDRVVHMAEESVDVAIRIGGLPDSQMHARRLGQVHQVICASPAYLQSHPPLRHPHDLAGHTIISGGAGPSASRWTFSGTDGMFDVPVQARLTTTSNHAAIVAALEGFGVARLMSYQAVPHIKQGGLQEVLQDFVPPSQPIHLVHRDGRQGSMKVRAFVDMALSVLPAEAALEPGHKASVMPPPLDSAG